MSAPVESARISFLRCQVRENRSDQLPAVKPWPLAAPAAEFDVLDRLVAGNSVRFRCTSTARTGSIVERLWDFGEGIPGLTEEPVHVFGKPGEYQVTLIVWDTDGLGARVTRTVQVMEP